MVEYQGFEFLVRRQHGYYNGQGQAILTVGINAANDTSGVSLYGYDAFGKQVLKQDYYMDNGKHQKIRKLFFYLR